MDWPGHAPFPPSFAWSLVKPELTSKLPRWFHGFSVAFSFLLHCCYFWLLVGLPRVMESLQLFSDISPLVISVPNIWGIYLAMPNILLPSFLSRFPSHIGPGQQFPHCSPPHCESRKRLRQVKFTEAWFSPAYSPLPLPRSRGTFQHFNTAPRNDHGKIHISQFFLLGFLSENVPALSTI